MSQRGKRQTPSRQTPTPTPIPANVAPSGLKKPTEGANPAQASTNANANANASAANASPVSPTRAQRIQEKVELQSLNDRLAAYIERVRNLEGENARITHEITVLQTSRDRETTTIRTMFENELSDARQLLDETSKEKAKLEIDIKRLWEELDEVKLKLEKKTKECSVAESNARVYENRAADLGVKLNAANNERKKISDDFNDLLKDNERIRKQLDEARKNLESETLARVELENTIQSLREELAFKDQLHTQELHETRTNSRHVEITEIDGLLTDKYEARLQESLAELREQYEEQMQANRDEIEHLYESKIRGLESTANSQANMQLDTMQEMQESRKRIDALYTTISKLEADNNELTKRLREAERTIDKNRGKYATHIADLERECQALRDEIAKQLKEFQDLRDERVSLAIELSAYDKLLHHEEDRLNITPTQGANSPSSTRQSRGTPIRGSRTGTLKRKREEETEKTEYRNRKGGKSEIKIIESDPDGKFVKIQNTGISAIGIGGWQLSRGIENGAIVSYKFSRNSSIESGMEITIWSADSNAVHDLPTSIVMKTQKWPTGNAFRTNLKTTEGVEVSWDECFKRSLSSRYFSDSGRTRNSGDRTEDLYHHEGEPDANREKCFIM